ncbi:hypothetical protein SAMN02746041_00226 [Desulfacinum hydrothermale DSM 13146]|uniref:Uncharacterized protein n=1 Tax=Desulfacinum hydrothermale DSM 13146 TaxID=1121390 RepID=A0A1W1WZB7_9BACT|nr:hypothetical protein SAMN02746041_00226 [Desulfacinum hydrothermale DSM 13146]
MVLEETDRILQCPFCRVRLFVDQRPHFSHVLAPHPDHARKDLLFVPYWRFRGLVFALDGNRVAHRVLDTNARAVEGLAGMPSSLGLRPQALSLRFAGPEIPGRFLAPSLSRKDFLKRLGNGLRGRLSNLSGRLFFQAFIGEALSLIYSPVFREDEALVDAITGRNLSAEKIPQAGTQPSSGTAPPDPPAFRPTLCPHCGDDLEGERDTLVLFCPNCHSSWEMGPSGFHPVDTSFAPLHSQGTAWLPFWALDIRCQGLPLETADDLARLANISRNMSPEAASRPFRFLIPAFKVSPKHLLLLARFATLAQPHFPPRGRPPRAPLYPVTLPAVEAFQFTPILLGAVAAGKEDIFPKIRDTRFAFRDKSLIYFPFRRLGSEWIQDDLGCAIPANALRWGRRL